MDYYAVSYVYRDRKDDLDRIRPEHRAFLGALEQLVASGPLPETSPSRALIILRAESAAQVEEILDADPFHEAGLIADRAVEKWLPVIGVFAG
ncbi:MAG TPA: YciI family protein [Arachnia sp.]|mgnify:CR=1 FL=1|nr:YciI family protein [Arachnia sp.]